MNHTQKQYESIQVNNFYSKICEFFYEIERLFGE